MSGSESTRNHDAGAGVDWGKVADGIGLAGFGVFFLLATTRGLPPGFWLDALSFWPVLLISAGIRVTFEKSPLPWGVVLGPLVVLGTLSWLAWGTPPSIAPPGEWRAVSAVRPEGLDAARLEVRGVGARVLVEARALGAGVLAEGRSASRGDFARLREVNEPRGEIDAPREASEGSEPRDATPPTARNTITLRLEGHGGGATVVPGRKSIWELAVAQDVPMSVDLGGVMSRSDLRLERGVVSGVEARGAFQAVVLRLPPARGRVAVELGGPFCAFHLIVPDGSRVHLGKTFPMSLVFRGPATDEALGEDEPGYAVSFGGPFGSLTIEEAPLPEGVWVPPPAASPARPAEAPPDPGLPAEAPPGLRPPAP